VQFRQFKEGAISAEQFSRAVDRGCPGIGACPVMGTANTMAAMAEALGMSLPGNTATPGSDSRLLRIAFNAGKQVVLLHRENIKPSDIMTFDGNWTWTSSRKLLTRSARRHRLSVILRHQVRVNIFWTIWTRLVEYRPC
jgi:hypothetical protein